MNDTSPSVARPWPWSHLAALSVAALALLPLFWGTFEYLYATWQREEYSHGFMVPLISVYLIWQKRERLAALPLVGSAWGIGLVAVGLLVYFAGSLASITTIDTYALVLLIMGLALAIVGLQGFRLLVGPLAMLFLMNPIPAFLFNNLSSALQLISSKIGVAVIKLFGISVLLEGNVIDLGIYKLQVVEACSGLRYLFPLLTLGFIVVSLVPAKLWIRSLLVASTVPVTVFMNSFRIGVIGVLVDRYGTSQAEGFLHDFEGWVIFMSCFAILLVETRLLLWLSGDKRGLRDLISLGPEAAPPVTGAAPPERRLGLQPLVAIALVLLAAWPALALPDRVEFLPPRKELMRLPLLIDGWEGHRQRMESQFLDELKLDDFALADYVKQGETSINLYIAYYASQRTGQATHSPSSCLPGAGWRMTDFGQQALTGVKNSQGAPLRVNRAVIQLGEQRQLVYYWFQQRGRDITNEYAVKWYLFHDSLVMNRSDGALVRLITTLGKGEDTAQADARLSRFAAALTPQLPEYVPD